MTPAWAEREMRGAALWDRRCVRSAAAVLGRRYDRPLVSFSKACGPAVRQAAHRFCSHPNTTVDGLLRGHFQQTAARVRRAFAAGEFTPDRPLLVLQDTTDYNYTSHPATEGLGPIRHTLATRGLFAHPALVAPTEGPPLGLAHLSLWARDPEAHGKTRSKSTRAREATACKESQKWLNGLWGAEATLPPEIPFLLIADREGDFFDYFAADRRPNTDLLVRAHEPRRVLVQAPASSDGRVKPVKRGAGEPLPEVLAAAPREGSLEVAVPRQPGKKARVATVTLRVVRVWLLPPVLRRADDAVRNREPQAVYVVEAREEVPPTGEQPLHWVLLSTRPVEGYDEAVRTIGYYRRRWLIEDLSLVMKSGLRAERLQMDDAHTLQNTLALLYVVAWRVLHLRDTARFLPDAPAEVLVDAEERAVLEAVARRPLPRAADVVLALAQLAGYQATPKGGPPGVRTLWDGLQRLEGAVLGWRLARQQL